MLRAIARNVWAGRESALRLCARHISAAYRRTLLGYALAFLPPLWRVTGNESLVTT